MKGKRGAGMAMTTKDFQELLWAVEHLYYWQCDANGNILETNAPRNIRQGIHSLFIQSDFPQKVEIYSKDADTPYALGMYMGLEWFVVIEKKNGNLEQMHLLGPVFFSPVDEEQLEDFLREYEGQGMAFHSRHLLIRSLKELPVIFQKYFTQYALMLDFVVNHRHLSYEDVNFHVKDSVDENKETRPRLYRESRIFLAEMLGRLAMGDLSVLQDKKMKQGMNYAMLPTNAAAITKPGRTLKDAALIFTAKCADAAVSGGMSPEIADALADSYMGQIEKDLSGVELMRLMGRIYEDYLRRMHAIKEEAGKYSEKTQACMDYIDLHIKEKINVTTIAQTSGYSVYYLSRQFYRETGEHLPAYIRRKKIEYAAMLLRTTDLEVAQIAEDLSFCSASHFSDCFHKTMGCSPIAYRARIE